MTRLLLHSEGLLLRVSLLSSSLGATNTGALRTNIIVIISNDAGYAHFRGPNPAPRPSTNSFSTTPNNPQASTESAAAARKMNYLKSPEPEPSPSPPAPPTKTPLPRNYRLVRQIEFQLLGHPQINW
ncbi:hypothetical protein N9B42_02700 [Akkermansiaceae bacterium]|nr:hypothetical protein [Akkermansiaceae bacterium]